MTYDDLKNCAALAREIKRIEEMEEILRSRIERLSVPPQEVPASNAHQSDKLGDGVAVLMELAEQWRDRVETYAQHVAAVEACIEGVKDADQRIIMRMRYVDGLTWPEISRTRTYHERWCRELCERGLESAGIRNKAE